MSMTSTVPSFAQEPRLWCCCVRLRTRARAKGKAQRRRGASRLTTGSASTASRPNFARFAYARHAAGSYST